MKENQARKARWSILVFALTLMVGSFGLAGCPDDDDDDDFFKNGAPGVVQQDDAGAAS